MDSPIVIRIAVPDDVEAIGAAHRKSVLDLAKNDYPKEIMDEWAARPTPESLEGQKNRMRDGIEITWVALKEKNIVGFAVLVPEKQELRALYVVGQAAKRGIARQLLETLEKKATALGLKKLNLHSSPNAKAFYEKHDFKNLGSGFHEMPSGQKMPCFVMEKIL